MDDRHVFLGGKCCCGETGPAPVDPGEDVDGTEATVRAILGSREGMRDDEPIWSDKAIRSLLATIDSLRSAPVDRVGGEGLDAAWKEAEAALPDGWAMGLRIGLGVYVAEAWSTDDGTSHVRIDPDAATALRELRAALVNDETPGGTE